MSTINQDIKLDHAQRRRAAELVEAVGTDPEAAALALIYLRDRLDPGTGACICKHSPEAFLKNCEHWVELPTVSKAVMVLDHRCARHGEKAQPALWGRHKELELTVTWAQWDSLGVKEKQP